MAKGTRRAPSLEQLPSINHLLSSKDTYPDSLVGKDITKPRDIYTFLSLGHLPVNPLQWPHEENAGKKKVKISLSTITTSSKHWDDGLSQNSYIQFDAHHPLTGFPVLPAITRVSSASCLDDDDDDDENDLFEGDPILTDNIPRKSIINEEDHKIKISTTYIFAPTERLHETVKYKKNVSLPRIKPKKGLVGDTPKSNVLIANEKTTCKSRKNVAAETPGVSPRKSDMYQGTSSLFGMRPECIFLNNQLGDRNPLYKHSKESPTQLVPKAGAGMNDLKDYDGYPEVYWELRDQTIAQPEDLEADMIDRDLYRLRQISSLKLNTIERTFQVAQDPFRKWRSKTGEPIFSPRQQQRPCNRVHKERGKGKDVPVYHQNLLKPIPGLKMSRLKIGNNDSQNKHDETPLSSSRDPESFRINQHNSSTSGLKELEIPIGKSDETPRDSTTEATPRDMLAASLDTYRRMGEEREEQMNGDGDLSIQKLHQLKGKREKKVIKTALIQVDLDSLDTYKREHRTAPKRQLSESQNVRSLNNSVNRETLGHANLNSSLVSPKLDSPKINSARSLNEKNLEKCRIAMEEELHKTGDHRKGSDTTNGKLPIKAPVASILFNPQNGRVNNDGELFYHATSRPGIPSPNASDSSTISKEKQKKGDTPLRHVRLEVFAERRDPRSPIKIPTGRTTYHPHLPSCRLDLANYPPSNPRQTCGKRSNSAGFTEGRQTTLTHSTQASRQRLGSSEGRGENRNIIPPRSSDNSGVNIRFGGQGKVIVTSSREGRRSR